VPHIIQLTSEEDRALLELSSDNNVPPRVRQRAVALRLSARNWTVPRIAEFLDWHPQSVRQAFHRWWDRGLEGLFEASGRGLHPRWQDEDIAHLENRALAAEHAYNSQQLSVLLESERGVRLSAIQLRKVLKKRASSGNAHAKAVLERIRGYRHKKQSSQKR
jgi:DNA-binding transcriptional LysR family regulator